MKKESTAPLTHAWRAWADWQHTSEKDEFDQRDAKLVALCVDTKENHRKWIEDVQELQEVVVWFPIIADENAEISRLLNLVKPMVRAVRPTVHGFLCRSFGFIYFLGDRPLRGVFLSLSFSFLPSLPHSLTHSLNLSLSLFLTPRLGHSPFARIWTRL